MNTSVSLKCCYAPPPPPPPNTPSVVGVVGGRGGHNGGSGTANRSNPGAVSGSECPAILFTTTPSISMEAALYRVHLPLQGGPAWDHRPALFSSPGAIQRVRTLDVRGAALDPTGPHRDPSYAPGRSGGSICGSIRCSGRETARGQGLTCRHDVGRSRLRTAGRPRTDVGAV